MRVYLYTVIHERGTIFLIVIKIDQAPHTGAYQKIDSPQKVLFQLLKDIHIVSLHDYMCF